VEFCFFQPNGQLSDAEIISTYNAELRGIENYYALAMDVKRKLNKLFYVAHYSLFKTLAARHNNTLKRIIIQLRDKLWLPVHV